jgi:hypothetical protein
MAYLRLAKLYRQEREYHLLKNVKEDDVISIKRKLLSKTLQPI